MRDNKDYKTALTDIIRFHDAEINGHLEARFLAILTLTDGICPYCKEQVFKTGKEHFKLHNIPQPWVNIC